MTRLLPIEHLFAIEVPRDACKFSHLPNLSMVAWYEGDHPIWDSVKVPPGSYEILFPTLSATEQQAAGVVESHLYPFDNTIMGFEDYRHYGYASCETAKESLQSLLRFNGLDASKNYLLIKKTT